MVFCLFIITYDQLTSSEIATLDAVENVRIQYHTIVNLTAKFIAAHNTRVVDADTI